MAMTKTQHQALRWLRDQGGHASLDQYSRAFARGQKARFTPGTWLRLFISGHISQSPLPGHFGITAEGIEAARKARP